MNTDFIVNPDAGFANATMTGSSLHNQGYAFEAHGDFAKAEAAYLRAIDVKERGFGPGNTSTAVSQNALGELYIKMDKLSEAEEMLLRALKIRNEIGPQFDAAVTRENLGHLYEKQGDLLKAKDIRLQGASKGAMACGNFYCPKQCPKQIFKRTDLQNCGRCRAVFYCCKPCQAADWKARHKKFCKPKDELKKDATVPEKGK
ncbi:hypothetical protein EVG20_g3943 [Dentipellis fragilis]|uniref:MYND-type domain-containing protein n=1 Tax=Dentipellis fragilis TaxID=205917 RepID=A0A4Y9Z0K2_9AGAM|nr:hypothetical protein EVG20_g3943 [Dentipellis fragilis]